jgi:hypothetical protein
MEYFSDKSELTENSLADSNHLVIVMFKSKHMKYIALSGFFGLFAMMFGTISQGQGFAQITPAPEKYGGGSSDQSSSNNPSSNDDGSGESSNSGSSDSLSSNNGNEGQDSGTSDEEQKTTREESTDSDSDERNPLVEEIISKVNQDFAAVSMPALEW